MSDLRPDRRPHPKHPKARPKLTLSSPLTGAARRHGGGTGRRGCVRRTGGAGRGHHPGLGRAHHGLLPPPPRCAATRQTPHALTVALPRPPAAPHPRPPFPLGPAPPSLPRVACAAVVGAAEARTARGAWGAYRGAPLPHLAMAEGGQSSTGSALQWLVRLFGGDRDEISLPQLDAEAKELPVGAEGVGMLETLQGSRTPVTDPRARGALLGLTLHHSRAHIWRAALEAICLGTKVCCAALRCPVRPEPPVTEASPTPLPPTPHPAPPPPPPPLAPRRLSSPAFPRPHLVPRRRRTAPFLSS